MSAVPRISVLMTVFNAGRFLREAVESICAQTFKDFEFVIIDDASTDGSVDELKKWEREEVRIRLICNTENSGQTACLNQGLREARGEWVARQDADDVSLPRRLEKQWRCVTKEANVVLAGVNGWILDASGAVTGMIHVPPDDAAVRASMLLRNPFVHTGVIFRRTDSRGEVVQYDERYRICQDWELWSRLLEDGRGVNLSERLVGYRHHSSSLSHESSEKTREESDRVVAAILAKPGDSVGMDERLVRGFREGLRAADRKEFWKSYGRRPASAEAVHRVQAAGAVAAEDWGAALAELAVAARRAPFWTSGVLVRSLAIRLGLIRNLKTGSCDRGKRSAVE